MNLFRSPYNARTRDSGSTLVPPYKEDQIVFFWNLPRLTMDVVCKLPRIMLWDALGKGTTYHQLPTSPKHSVSPVYWQKLTMSSNDDIQFTSQYSSTAYFGEPAASTQGPSHSIEKSVRFRRMSVELNELPPSLRNLKQTENGQFLYELCIPDDSHQKFYTGIHDALHIIATLHIHKDIRWSLITTLMREFGATKGVIILPPNTEPAQETPPQVE